jgi:hypothetical protein
LGVSYAWRQAGDGGAAAFQLISEREGKTIDERLRTVIDRLKQAWCKSGHQSRQHNTTLPTAAHHLADFMDKIKCAGDIRVMTRLA